LFGKITESYIVGGHSGVIPVVTFCHDVELCHLAYESVFGGVVVPVQRKILAAGIEPKLQPVVVVPGILYELTPAFKPATTDVRLLSITKLLQVADGVADKKLKKTSLKRIVESHLPSATNFAKAGIVILAEVAAILGEY
jgi:hypothetical protein